MNTIAKFMEKFKKNKSSRNINTVPTNILFDMLEPIPPEDVKWLNFSFWFWLNGDRLENLAPDEVIKEWKVVSVPEMQTDRMVRKIKRYIVKTRKQWIKNEEKMKRKKR